MEEEEEEIEHAKMTDVELTLTDKENMGQNLVESLLSRDVFLDVISQIQRNLTKNRKARIKFLCKVYQYLKNIYENLLRDNSIVVRIIENLDDFQQMIVDTLKLCNSLSQPSSMISRVYYMIHDIGVFLESFVEKIYVYCHSNDLVFGKVVMKLLEPLINVSCENPGLWLYSVAVSAAVLNIINVVSDTKEFDEMSIRCEQLFKKIPAAVFGCGDFSCQYYLMILFSNWIHTIGPSQALGVVKSLFPYVDHNSAKLLLEKENIELTLRKFLNVLNLSKRGPQNIIPIQCLYLFMSNTPMNPPLFDDSSNNFWVDFSVESDRLHAFYSANCSNAGLSSLNIRKDQIDSICLNWVVNEITDSQNMETQGKYTTQSTISNNEKVLFLHLVLNVDVNEIVQHETLFDHNNKRSIYFVFRDEEYVVKVIKEMKFYQHQCGNSSCNRPKALLKLLSTEHNLRYKASWCTNSEVFGLDESSKDRSVEDTMNSSNVSRPEVFMNSSLVSLPETSMNSTYASRPEVFMNSSLVSLPETSMNSTYASRPETSMNSTSVSRPETTMSSDEESGSNGDTFGITQNSNIRTSISGLNSSNVTELPSFGTPALAFCKDSPVQSTSKAPYVYAKTPKPGERELNTLDNTPNQTSTPGYAYCQNESSSTQQLAKCRTPLCTPIPVERQRKILQPLSPTPGANYCASLRNDGVQDDYYKNTFVNETLVEADSFDNATEKSFHNISSTTNETNFEDPFSRSMREKYTYLYMHAPFHTSTPKPKLHVHEDGLVSQLAKSLEDSFLPGETSWKKLQHMSEFSNPSSPVSSISQSPNQNRLNFTPKLTDPVLCANLQDSFVTQPKKFLLESLNSTNEELAVSSSPDFIPNSVEQIEKPVNITSTSTHDESKEYSIIANDTNDDLESKTGDSEADVDVSFVPASDSVVEDSSSPPLSPVFGFSREHVNKSEGIPKSPTRSLLAVISTPAADYSRTSQEDTPNSPSQSPVFGYSRATANDGKDLSKSPFSSPRVVISTPLVCYTRVNQGEDILKSPSKSSVFGDSRANLREDIPKSPCRSPVFGYSKAHENECENIPISPCRSPLVVNATPVVKIVKETIQALPKTLKMKGKSLLVSMKDQEQIHQSKSVPRDEPLPSSSDSELLLQTVLKVPPMVEKSAILNSKKPPCWANAFTEFTKNQQKRYDEDPTYDPYDMLTSSQYEEYKNRLFPQAKTYARKRKPTTQRKPFVKKKRVGVIFEDDDGVCPPTSKSSKADQGRITAKAKDVQTPFAKKQRIGVFFEDDDGDCSPKNKRSKADQGLVAAMGKAAKPKTKEVQTSWHPKKYKSFFNLRP